LAFCCYFTFFFQAEDGIRDFHVTGVQTCALPILPQGAFSVICPAFDRPADKGCRGGRSLLPQETILKKQKIEAAQFARSRPLRKIGRASCRDMGDSTEVEAIRARVTYVSPTDIRA